MIAIIKIKNEADYRFADSEKEAVEVVAKTIKNPEMLKVTADGYRLRCNVVAAHEETYRLSEGVSCTPDDYAHIWTPLCAEYDRMSQVACR